LKALATMAQKDATEQAKEVLRQIIRYRFWISISVAALFALIAYFVGSGPVRAKAAAETTKIKGAEDQVRKYTSSTLPTPAYQPIVLDKTRDLTKDVNSAWKTLFDRQAPLLTWPDTVQERFRKWGRKWPENTAPKMIELAIVDYIEAYPGYVSMVYKTANPFDYETGAGVVVTPPEAALLRPAQFTIEHTPDLGKVWAAQERLWIQRTLLEVVAQVNKNAKSWDTAVIRQILSLEVGLPTAQDQRSIAKNESLEEAQPITAPGEETTAPAAGGAGNPLAELGGKFGSMSGGMGGMAGGGMGGGGLGSPTQASESVYYVKSDAAQYKKMPVVMTVLVEQDRVQEFLVELENSPMSIQVMDFELERPSARVAKPEKGTASAGGFGAGMGMMMGQMQQMQQMQQQRMMNQMGSGAYGGMAGMMQNQMRNQMQMQMNQNRGMGGAGMGGMSAEPQRKGTDVRGKDRTKQRGERDTAAKEAKGPSLFYPYFDIVQVTVYGQARFFMPPPVEPAAEPSLGETAAAPAAAVSPAPPAGPAAAAKGAPSQSPPGPSARPEPKSTAPKAAAGAAPKVEKDAAAAKPAPKVEKDAATAKPAPKAGATKTQSDGATAKP